MDQDIINRDSRVLFVNDSFKDATWRIIHELHKENSLFSGIDLTRNQGNQNALLAGLLTAKYSADVVISMDAYLQYDVGTIDAMLEKYHEGGDRHHLWRSFLTEE